MSELVSRKSRFALGVAVAAAVIGGLLLSRAYSFLLFHVVSELFSVVVACAVAMVAWNTRRHIQNGYILWLALWFPAVAALDLVHTLAYEGMNVFAGYGANLPTQLWIAARSTQSLVFLAGLAFLRRRPSVAATVVAAVALTAVLLAAIFSRRFPTCYDEAARGLTTFKIVSEYIICGVLLATLVGMLRLGGGMDRRVLALLAGATGVMIVSELSFTLYSEPTGWANFAGHALKIAAFWLIYRALIQEGLTRPYAVMFGDLKLSDERHRAVAESLAAESGRLNAIFDSAPEAIVVVDAAGQVTLANAAARGLFACCLGNAGSGPARLGRCGATTKCFSVELPLASAARDGLTLRDVEVSVHDGLGHERELLANAAPIRGGQGLLGAVGVFRDVTESKRIQRQGEQMIETLRRARGELDERVREKDATLESTVEELAREVEARVAAEKLLRQSQRDLLEAERRERRRLGQDLHDTLGQNLIGITFLARILRGRLGGQDAPGAGEVADIERLAKQSTTQARLLARGLCPVDATADGLMKSLRSLAENTCEVFSIDCQFRCRSEVLIHSDQAAMHLFYITQEAVTNAIKHGKARQIVIELAGDAGGVTLSIRDDGAGMSASRGEGIGLRTMSFRAQAMGGVLSIESPPGEGTTVTCRLKAQGQPQETTA